MRLVLGRHSTLRLLAFGIAIVMVTSVGTASVGPESAGPAKPGHSTPSPAVLEAGLADELGDGPRGVIVHFDQLPAEGVDLPVQEIRYVFENIPAVYALATVEDVRTLQTREDVTFVEDAWKSTEFHLNTATLATRAREVYDPDSPQGFGIAEPSPALTGPDTPPINGSGVGVAIVDSGFDGTHPDFQGPDKQGGNYVVTSAGVQEAGPYTAMGSGHGTFVAGSAAGTGQASDGKFAGAAPGATLYTFATWRNSFTFNPTVTQPSTVIQPAIAFDWILSHGDEQEPAIDVVANAWSCTDPACNKPGAGEQAHMKLASELANSGDVVLFSVGERGGFGLHNHVSTEARIPTPGVLGIGMADDEDTGQRNDCTEDASSKGAAFEPATWPDLIAPGDDIQTPGPLLSDGSPRTSDVPGPDRNPYVTVEGSSASTGHAAGVVALLLQADPSLSPGEVELLLENNAHEIPPASEGECPVPYVQADPDNPHDGANYASGHGLIDAFDAVEDALEGFERPSEEESTEQIPGTFVREGPAIDVGDKRLYFSGESGFSEEKPDDTEPRVRPLGANEPIVHTTEPLETTRTHSAIMVELWAGSPQETGATRCSGIDFNALAFHIDASEGTESFVGLGKADTRHVPPTGPWPRSIEILFDEPVTFEPGDQVKIRISMGQCSGAVSGANPVHMTAFTGSEETPSRITFSQKTDEVLPETRTACEELRDESDVNIGGCAWIGGDLRTVHFYCDGRARVEWFGPPGSKAIAHCNGAEAVCTVPDDPDGEWGRCEASTPVPEPILHFAEYCTYVTEDGEKADGVGFCTDTTGTILSRPGSNPPEG